MAGQPDKARVDAVPVTYPICHPIFCIRSVLAVRERDKTKPARLTRLAVVHYPSCAVPTRG